jgi:hypothetical protein
MIAWASAVRDPWLRLEDFATPDDGAALRGSEAACVNCHRRSGVGSSEGNITISLIAGAYLFAPATEPVFAALSGLGGGEWAPVQEFCEEERLPRLFRMSRRRPAVIRISTECTSPGACCSKRNSSPGSWLTPPTLRVGSFRCSGPVTWVRPEARAGQLRAARR